jgi:hypothetical protein
MTYLKTMLHHLQNQSRKRQMAQRDEFYSIRINKTTFIQWHFIKRQWCIIFKTRVAKDKEVSFICRRLNLRHLISGLSSNYLAWFFLVWQETERLTLATWILPKPKFVQCGAKVRMSLRLLAKSNVFVS